MGDSVHCQVLTQYPAHYIRHESNCTLVLNYHAGLRPNGGTLNAVLMQKSLGIYRQHMKEPPYTLSNIPRLHKSIQYIRGKCNGTFFRL